MLSVFDPQNNEVFFDAKSIGLTIVNSELAIPVICSQSKSRHASLL